VRDAFAEPLKLTGGPSAPAKPGIGVNRARIMPWISWILGAAVLAAVIMAALHVSDGRILLHLVERASAPWLLVAILLQVATYFAQGAIWRRVGAAAGHPISLRSALEISLAKQFADQALPSGGVGSSILVAQALERRQMPAAVVRAAVLLNIASYYLAYVAAIPVVFVILARTGHLRMAILLPGTLFIALAGGLTAAALVLAGRHDSRAGRLLDRVPLVHRAFEFVAGAQASLVRKPSILLAAIGLQVSIILLDAATVWSLIAALGVTAPVGGVFASFLVASFFRIVGIVPGGLGTFEASSVLTLRMAGVELPVALSATLLFRGLSFWFPMLPGYWSSRRATRAQSNRPREPVIDSYWSLSTGQLLARLDASADGLTSSEAASRLLKLGPNDLRERRSVSRFGILARQFRSPLLLLLVFAALASILIRQWLDAATVLAIVLATVGIGFAREAGAEAALASLRLRIGLRTTAVRDGRAVLVPREDVVPGDIVLLSAGSLIPADGVVLETSDFYVSEAVLTGESFPTLKRPGIVDPSVDLVQRTNCVFFGTNVRSGSARCLVVRTGAATEFGAIAHRLSLRPPETEFERGVRRFGYFLTSAMLVMVLLVFVVHVFRGRPPAETLLFAIALAVGLSPELLPAILGINLARGAQSMARQGVLVRRLSAIENLGSIDILCTDKTGTLTEGVVQLEGAYDPAGAASKEVLDLGACNAALETGIASALDEAITTACKTDRSAFQKLGEVPFDFVRKRVTVIVRSGDGARLITKGAFHEVAENCTRTSSGAALDADTLAQLERRYEDWTRQGTRVLAVATRRIDERPLYDRNDEHDMEFVGFLAFLDRPREGVTEALKALRTLGVSVKLITGDSGLVAKHVADLVGMRADSALTGRDLARMNDEALWSVAERTDLFVEVDPNQKERIILALKKMGHVVGFLGDGVNDAPAMHAADTSLSVETAVDVAREVADFVLLDRGLDVIRRGIEEGRKTFANTLKYILITTSANLGNMVSMAGASLFLPFLPLTAGQILLNNLLSDVPAVGIADDRVDPESVDRPRRWDIANIARYMIAFGILSSVFDFITFGALMSVLPGAPANFRTGWFVESLLTELVVVLVLRTRRRFFKSRPGSVLLVSTIVMIPFACAIPYLPFASVFGFVPLPGGVLAMLVAITLFYVAATELVKRVWFREVVDVGRELASNPGG
jgi:Mg2+-importing ATPase